MRNFGALVKQACCTAHLVHVLTMSSQSGSKRLSFYLVSLLCGLAIFHLYYFVLFHLCRQFKGALDGSEKGNIITSLGLIQRQDIVSHVARS